MIAQPNLPASRPDLTAALQDIIDRHGAWRVLRAAFAAALRHRPPARGDDAGQLNAHLRRDIGLPPLPPGRPSFWDLR